MLSNRHSDSPTSSARAETIEIVVNGETRRAPRDASLPGLLEWLGVEPSRVAVELNRRIVPKAQWSGTGIGAGDRLEIVQFVGGG